MFKNTIKYTVLLTIACATFAIAIAQQSIPDVKPIFNDSAGFAYTEENTTFVDSVDNAILIDQKNVFAPIVGLEVLSQNVLVWSWDRFILNKNYAHTGPYYWKRNLREGWEWDHNHWAINFFGHPYQGTFYYTTARASGFEFYRSLLWTALGSYTWELFAETEYPSINDFITTSISGSIYGEVLYRFSRKLYNTEDAPWYKKIAAFALQPGGYLQRTAFGNRDNHTGNTALDMDIFIGSGTHFGNNYRFGNKKADQLDEKWDDKHVAIGTNIEHGRPYRKVKRPFDYFTLYGDGEFGNDGALAHLDVTGKLLNAGAHGRGHWVDFATYLDYDTFYGDLATIGTISLGAGIDLALWLLPKTRFRITNQAYWIMLGSTDMGYDDLIKEVHPEYNPDKDSYQYNMGVKYSLYLEIWTGNRFTLSNRINIEALHTMPNSIPHYGAYGWDFLLFNYTKAEYQIFNWLSVGAQLNTYLKFAAYTSELFDPMYRRMFSYTVYFAFNIF